MDANQQSDHSDDEASAVALPQHINATSEHDCPLPGTVPVDLTVRDDGVMQEELSLDEGAAGLVNESEDQQSRVLESVESGLGNVLFDVWCSTLLPLLTIPDIFQLCGVSRHLRELLHNEYTFKGLCQHRYQLSPYLEFSYIQSAKVMYIATRVASLYETEGRFCMKGVIVSNNPYVYKLKMRLLGRLSSLVLRLPENVNTPPSWTSTGQLISLAQEHCLFAEEACTYLPNLSPTLIKQRCNVDTVFGATVYRLQDVVNLSFERCSSIEQYQRGIIKDLEKDVSEMVPHVSSANSYSRLVCIAKGYYNTARRDAIVISSLMDEYYTAHLTEYLANPWTHNPFYYCGIMYANIDVAYDDRWASRHWIHATGMVAKMHSVINLLIKGILRTEQAVDYFTAILEYTKLWKSLPQSSRPRRDDLYSGLGTYILGSSRASDSKRMMSSVELLDAMQRYGSELAANASPKS
ncbi:uncharacterized protein LOC135824970 [Sycon ciliatum]|uniref:uncharacterized protein LOC135824970 n=1 Tax=Sycon ciliatum TaxID=27933 RepID=UPI0020A9440C